MRRPPNDRTSEAYGQWVADEFARRVVPPTGRRRDEDYLDVAPVNRPHAQTPNRYAGNCWDCGELVPVGGAWVQKFMGRWETYHTGCGKTPPRR